MIPITLSEQITKNPILISYYNFSWQGQTVVSTIVADELVSRSQCEAVGSSNATSSWRRIRRGEQQHTPKDPVHPKSTGLVEASWLLLLFPGVILKQKKFFLAVWRQQRPRALSHQRRRPVSKTRLPALDLYSSDPNPKCVLIYVYIHIIVIKVYYWSYSQILNTIYDDT